MFQFHSKKQACRETCVSGRFVYANIKTELLRDILAETGVTVVWRKYWRFREHDIPAIYPDWVCRKEFPAMPRNMLLGPALVLIVTGENAIAENRLHSTDTLTETALLCALW